MKVLKIAVQEAEKAYIIHSLIKNKFHMGKTAKELSIDRKTIYNKISVLNIDVNKLKLDFYSKLIAE